MTHHHRITRVATLMLAVGAIAAAPASAKFSETGGAPCLTGCSNSAAYTAPADASANNGFDWGDAGIGAGAALVVVATAGGGAVMFGRRQGRSRLAS